MILNLACRLPVVIYGKPNYAWSGGFLTFPAGTYAADPSGVINMVGDGELQTEAKPQLSGYALTWPFYDRARNRWLPIGSGQSSPDGSSYAYVAPPLGGAAALFTSVVATGASEFRQLPAPAQGDGEYYNLGDYDGRYAYLVALQVDSFPKGVWRINPATGAITPLLPTSAGSVLLVQSGLAWLGLNNPADPSPPHPPKGQAFDTIESVNLLTGATTTWIYRPGQSVVFWGLDSSAHPVVMITSGPDFGRVPNLNLIDAPGGGGTAIPAGARPLGVMEADQGRLWFGGADGIYYWTRSTGFIKVYDFVPDPSAVLPQSIYPAGHCV